ncbi:tannase/feruloyl esterase family alpha/beta hydrolase [Streptomyces sp. NPDC008150]|uniref:tannase/feruloyl esterase family alpha/beta hydrolase n=1 Tax=Streptomyces sp. NPDC008150 TaxID=3364816 RepID=UPI0036E1F571
MARLLARWRPGRAAALLAALAVLVGTVLSLAGSQAASGPVGNAAYTAATAADAGTPPAIDCTAVAKLDLAAIPGAPTAITSAKVMAADANSLGKWAACDVTGLVAPQIQFELRLPLTGWQQNYLQVGCGGNCGSVNLNNVPAAADCTPLTDGGFAVATNNEGHFNGSGVFATDPTLRVDFGYKADHEVAVAAKEIIKRFYGRAATHSYFSGCSQGGHQALTEAQRYPKDFNGIVAGAPANNWTALNVFAHAWNAQAVYSDNGRATLTTPDLAPLHAAVLKGCGATDGVITDPLSCTWDPASIKCAAGQTSAPDDFCLNAAQVKTLHKLYAGPHDENGKLLYPGWQLLGSELNWDVIVPATADTPSGDQNFVKETIRYMVFPNARPTLTYKDVKFTSAYFNNLLRLNHATYDATDPDLSAFKAAGGKLILWHGLGDQHIPAVGTMAYYKAVSKTMGGTARTESFARLFLLPGVAHCGGGQGPNSFDALSAVMDWVTAGKAPASLVTNRLGTDGGTVASRPVFPYPYIAVNTTGGPADRASSYTKQLSTAERDVRVDYLGGFRSGYETVSSWIDGKWVTRPGKS